MKIDRELVSEIKKEANGDGSREARFAFLKRLRATREALSNPTVTTEFHKLLNEHGRVPVAICVASTLYARSERIDRWGLRWAMEVLKLWSNRPPSYISCGLIDDGLHPTRICEYAGSFIRLTTEEG